MAGMVERGGNILQHRAALVFVLAVARPNCKVVSRHDGPSQPQRKQRVRRAVPTIDDFGESAPSCNSQVTVRNSKEWYGKGLSTLFLQTSFKRGCWRITSLFRLGAVLTALAAVITYVRAC